MKLLDSLVVASLVVAIQRFRAPAEAGESLPLGRVLVEAFLAKAKPVTRPQGIRCVGLESASRRRRRPSGRAVFPAVRASLHLLSSSSDNDDDVGVDDNDFAFLASPTRIDAPSSLPQGVYPPEEELNLTEDGGGTSIDWDKEWKNVMAQKSRNQERPGKDFYKSEAEIAAIRAANEAQRKLLDVAKTVDRKVSFELPSNFKSVQSDSKFWISVLVALSFGAAIITAVTSTPPAYEPSGDSSYFI
jgi:hypothetical protein